MELQRLSQVAPHVNAFEFRFPEEALSEVRAMYSSSVARSLESPENASAFEGGRDVSGRLAGDEHSFYITSYGSAPLLWVSADDAATYAVFRRAFDSLGIVDDLKELVDFESDITMYCGFFVVGTHMPSEVWHVDYRPGANAYTLLTPLFELDPGHGDLLYRDVDGVPTRYTYACGEGLIVGEYVDHTTEPYEATGALRVLLSLTFGTDKLEYWDILRQTIGGQSQYVVLPCGHEWTDCSCVA